jgi:hypothetical protein
LRRYGIGISKWKGGEKKKGFQHLVNYYFLNYRLYKGEEK